ncbi:Kel2 protein [Saccharomycopsis crataegensis]|uniref:Kel2 protein n=1 Tax=Saccharomycopsis crataegensis TaxID=43959 RepID=A0AAV5QV85_9ASCO|nr:Kel2 protein [Saccharomycopsis crataegensis]
MAPFKLRKSKKKDSKHDASSSSSSKKDPKSPGTSVTSSSGSSIHDSTSESPVQHKYSEEMKSSAEFINRPQMDLQQQQQKLFSMPPPQQQQQQQQQQQSTGGSFQQQQGTPTTMNSSRQLPLIPTAGQSLSPIETPHNTNILRSTQANSGRPGIMSNNNMNYQQKPLPPHQYTPRNNNNNPPPPQNSNNPFVMSSRNTSQQTLGQQSPLVQAIQNFTPWSRVKLTASPFPRYRHTSSSVISEQGHVFVMGGLREGSVYGDLWALNSTTFDAKSIENFDGIPAPRVGHNSCLCGNAFIIFGGDTIQTNEQGELDNDLYLFNINSLKWTIPHPQGDRPCGRYGHTIGVIAKTNVQSKLYLFGGQLDSKIFNDLWVFDLSSFRKPTSHWEKIIPSNDPNDLDNIPPPLTNHSMVIFNYKLYMFGGSNLQRLSNDLYCFDPNLNSFSRLKCTGDIPPPIEEHSTTLIKNLMIVYGGKNSKSETVDSLYILNLNSFHWTRVESFMLNPGARCGHSITAIFNYSRKNQNGQPQLKDSDDRRFQNNQIIPTKVSPNALASSPLSSSKNKILIMGGDQLDYCTSNAGSFEKSNKDENFGTMIYVFDLDLYNEWSVKFKNFDLWDDKLPQILTKQASPVHNNNNGVFGQSSPFVKAIAANSVSPTNGSASTFTTLPHSENHHTVHQPIIEDNKNNVFSDQPFETAPPPVPPQRKDSVGSLDAFSTPPTTTTGSPQSLTREIVEDKTSNNAAMEKIQNMGASAALVDAGVVGNTTLETANGMVNNESSGSETSPRDFDLLDTYVNSSVDLLEKMSQQQPQTKLKKLDIAAATNSTIPEAPSTPVKENIEEFSIAQPEKRVSIPARSPKRTGSPQLNSPQDNGLSPTTADLYVSAISNLPEQNGVRSIDDQVINGTMKQDHQDAASSQAATAQFAKAVELLETELSELKLEMNNQAKAASDRIHELEQHSRDLEQRHEISEQRNAEYESKHAELQETIIAREQEVQESHGSLQGELIQKDKAIQQLQSEIEGIHTKHANDDQLEIQELQQQLAGMHEQLTQKHTELSTINEKFVSKDDEFVALSKELEQLKASSIAKDVPVEVSSNNDEELEALKQQLAEKDRIIEELNSSTNELDRGGVIESSSPISGSITGLVSDRDLNAIRRENIELHSELIKARANNETLNQKFQEFEPFMNNSIIELEQLNEVILHQKEEIESLTGQLVQTEALQDEVSSLQTENDILKKELENVKRDRSSKRTITNDKINNISTDISKLVTLWRSKKEITSDLDRSMITDESLSETTANDEDFANGSVISNFSTNSNSKAFGQLQSQINELIQINKEQELKNHALQEKVAAMTNEMTSLQEQAGKGKDLEKYEENYRNAMNSMKKTGRALEVSQKELNKQKELNSQLRTEIEDLQAVTDSSMNGDDDMKNAHYDFKIKDLEAELFIIKQERDELKDSVVSLRKKLMTGGK